jgi:hypothetical protein
MKAIARIVLLVSLLGMLAAPLSAWAAERGGALFGVTPGQRYAGGDSGGELTPEGYRVYRFAPNELTDIFTLAQARVSPGSGVVIDVSAAAIISDGAEAQAKFEKLKSWLEERFGKSERKKLASSELFTITKNRRKATFFLREDPLTDERLIYCNLMDLDAFGKARKEIPKIKIR